MLQIQMRVEFTCKLGVEHFCIVVSMLSAYSNLVALGLDVFEVKNTNEQRVKYYFTYCTLCGVMT